jgi:SAM-dependent methyltransferase
MNSKRHSCTLCGSVETSFLFEYRGTDIYADKLGLNEHPRWFVCRGCGVFFSIQYKDIDEVYLKTDLYDMQYDSAGIKARYDKLLSLSEGCSDNHFRAMRVREFHKRYIKDFARESGECFEILDIGAGTGVFLAKFLEKSYIGTALEINKIASEHIRRELKIKVYDKFLNELSFEKKFDIITMNKVIEHIKDPASIIGQIKKIIHKNGILYIEVPDSFSFEKEGDKSEAFGTGHHMVYNPDSLFYLMNKCGFEVLNLDRITEPSTKSTIFIFARPKRIIDDTIIKT